MPSSPVYPICSYLILIIPRFPKAPFLAFLSHTRCSVYQNKLCPWMTNKRFAGSASLIWLGGSA